MKKIYAIMMLVIGVLSAQDIDVYFNQLAEDYFLLGMRQYTQKEFEPALLSFQRSIQSYPSNHRITAAMMMEAKTYFALKNYEQAIIICDSLTLKFPTSSYKEDVFFTRGICYYNMLDYQRTLSEMEVVYSIAQQRLNKEHSYKVIDHIVTEFITENQLDSIVSVTSHLEIKTLYSVVLAEKKFNSANIEQATEILSSIGNENLDQNLFFRFNRLRSRIEKGNAVRLGVLLPLMGSSQTDTRDRRIAQEILEGIQLSILEYEERAEPGQSTIELDVQDSEKDSAKIHSIISEWSNNPLIVGIIGPVFSGETIHAAKLAQQYSLPIISPTATDEGISSLGNYVFQANSTNGSRGKALAQFAVNILGANKIAVLGSAVPSTAIQADSFIVEVKRLGAEILIDKRYGKGETDLRSYIREIRTVGASKSSEYVTTFRGKLNAAEMTRKLAALGVRMSLVDSIITKGAQLNLTQLFGDSAIAFAAANKFPYKKVIPFVDSLHYPVTTIDLLYCPIASSQEIGIITTQVAFFNIKTTLLGSGDWYDMNELDMNKRYADGVIFGSDRWLEQNESSSRISSRYAQRHGKQISENVMFGYDVTTMLLGLFKEGTLSREQFAEKLATVVNYSGLRNAISLSHDRVNRAMHILQFKAGKVSKVQTYSYQ